jgi:glutamate-1-semialdehyde 2,1-aminomutase
MMAVTSKRATIDEDYWQRFPTSAELFARAKTAIPSGVTHDARSFGPFPVYMSRASGAYKWDADGHKLLDHWMGHGALLLGHNHPTVTQAVSQALARGTHLGACHEDEVEWAELVRRLVPSAEAVRFTMSGTESTMLALRDARAYTRKPKVIRFNGNFHGWHDYAMVGYQPPFDTPTSAGIPNDLLGTMVSLPQGDIEAVRRTVDGDDQIGSVILEPAGGSNGVIPPEADFLRELRELTTQRGLVLIFDEVITGFRWAPGGAQEYYGVTPDLTTLAKIVAGGLPGGAVAGKADIMDTQTFTGDAKHDRFERVLQQGTFNCNLPSTAAGVAALKIVAEAEAIDYSNRMGKLLRDGMNDTLKRRGAAGIVYGECSVFHVMLGEGMAEAVERRDAVKLMGARGAAGPLRKAMLIEGVDFMRTGGFTSVAHGQEEIDLTLSAFGRAVERLQAEGVV